MPLSFSFPISAPYNSRSFLEGGYIHEVILGIYAKDGEIGRVIINIHRPLSNIFVVHNERRDSISGNLIDRALIAKMTYMISR